MNKQTKWLIGLIAVLVIVNISLMATIWMEKKERTPATTDDSNFFIKELKLGKGQQVAFDSLRKEYFERMGENKKKVTFIKERLVALLKENYQNEIKYQLTTSLVEKLAELKEESDKAISEHFWQLRSHLDSGQQKKFDHVIKDLFGAS